MAAGALLRRALCMSINFALVGAPAASYADGIDRPEYKCPDAPHAIEIEGGLLLPPKRVARIGCLMDSCAAHRDALEKKLEEGSSVSSTVVYVSVGIGFVAGILLTGAIVAVAR